MATPFRSANSSAVSTGEPTKASHYNNLRTDSLEALATVDYAALASTITAANPDVGQMAMAQDSDVLYLSFDGTNWIRIASASVEITPSGIEMSSNDRIYFDGGDNTYIHEAASDQLQVVVGGSGALKVNSSGTVFTSAIKATTGDPTGEEGLITINTNDNAIKIYADGAWRTIVTW